MSLINNYLKNLQERRTSVSAGTIMYHGSRTQNLKVIDPKEWVDALRKAHMATVWGSWDKAFAAMFCIDWRKNIKDIFIGDDLGFYVSLYDRDERHCYGYLEHDKDKPHCIEAIKNPKRQVVIPTRYKKILSSPCSLYTIQADKWTVPKYPHDYANNLPEAYTKQPAEVIKEIKYNTVLEAYKKNGITLLVENNYTNSTKWQRIFSKMKI